MNHLKLFCSLIIIVLLVNGVVAEQEIINGEGESIVNKTLCVFGLGKNCGKGITGHAVAFPPETTQPPPEIACENLNLDRINSGYIRGIRDELYKNKIFEKPSWKLIPSEGTGLGGVFTSARELEYFLATQKETRVGLPVYAINCVLEYYGYSDEREKKVIVASYYDKLNKLRYNMKKHLEYIVAIDRFNGEPLFHDLVIRGGYYTDDSEDFPNPIANELKEYKKYLIDHPPDPNEFNSLIVVSKTAKTLELIAKFEAMKRNDEMIIFKTKQAIYQTGFIQEQWLVDSPDYLSQLQDEIKYREERIKLFEDTIRNLKVIFPWTLGDVFDDYYELKFQDSGEDLVLTYINPAGNSAEVRVDIWSASYKGGLGLAIAEQLKSNRKEIIALFNNMQDSFLDLNNDVAGYPYVRDKLTPVLDPKVATLYPSIKIVNGDSPTLIDRKSNANYYLGLVGEIEKYQKAYEQGFWESVNSVPSQIILMEYLIVFAVIAYPFVTVTALIRGAQIGSNVVPISLGMRYALGAIVIGANLAYASEAVQAAIVACDEAFLYPSGELLNDEQVKQLVSSFGPSVVSDYHACMIHRIIAVGTVGLLTTAELSEIYSIMRGGNKADNFLLDFEDARNYPGIDSVRAARSKKTQEAIESGMEAKTNSIEEEFIYAVSGTQSGSYRELSELGERALRAENPPVNFVRHGYQFIILPNGEHPINKIAVALNKRGVELVWDPKTVEEIGFVAGVRINEEGNTLFLNNAFILSPEGIREASKAIPMHEIVHEAAFYLDEKGIESFLLNQYTPFTNPFGVPSSYGSAPGLADPTGYAYHEISATISELRYNLKPLKKARNILEKLSDPNFATSLTQEELSALGNEAADNVISSLNAITRSENPNAPNLALTRKIITLSQHSDVQSQLAMNEINAINNLDDIRLFADGNSVYFEMVPDNVAGTSGINVEFQLMGAGDKGKYVEVSQLPYSTSPLSGMVDVKIRDSNSISKIEGIISKDLNGFTLTNADKQKLVDVLRREHVPTVVDPTFGNYGQLKKSREMSAIAEQITAQMDDESNALLAGAENLKNAFEEVDDARIVLLPEFVEDFNSRINSILELADSYPDELLPKSPKLADHPRAILKSPSSRRSIVRYPQPKYYNIVLPLDEAKKLANGLSKASARQINIVLYKPNGEIRYPDKDIRAIILGNPANEQAAALSIVQGEKALEYWNPATGTSLMVQRVANKQAVVFGPKNSQGEVMAMASNEKTLYSEHMSSTTRLAGSEMTSLALPEADLFSLKSTLEIESAIYHNLKLEQIHFGGGRYLYSTTNEQNARAYSFFLGDDFEILSHRIDGKNLIYKYEGVTPPPFMEKTKEVSGVINGVEFRGVDPVTGEGNPKLKLQIVRARINVDGAIEKLEKKLGVTGKNFRYE